MRSGYIDCFNMTKTVAGVSSIFELSGTALLRLRYIEYSCLTISWIVPTVEALCNEISQAFSGVVTGATSILLPRLGN